MRKAILTTTVILSLTLTVIILIGCQKKGILVTKVPAITKEAETPNPNTPTQGKEAAIGNKEETLSIVLPTQIEILPFTKFKDWEGSNNIDGIEVYLRPLDILGDQTKAVGLFRFELYTYRKAHKDPRGERIGIWQVDLSSKEAQLLHWDKLTRTYKFRLGLTKEINITEGKYILDVTFIPIKGKRIAAEYTLHLKEKPKRWLSPTED